MRSCTCAVIKVNSDKVLGLNLQVEKAVRANWAMAKRKKGQQHPAQA